MGIHTAPLRFFSGSNPINAILFLPYLRARASEISKERLSAEPNGPLTFIGGTWHTGSPSRRFPRSASAGSVTAIPSCRELGSCRLQHQAR
jgi:hypothetical protein